MKKIYCDEKQNEKTRFVPVFFLSQKKRKFVSIKKIPTKNQEFCEYENRNCFFVPKFAFGLGFERKDSFTPNNTPSSP